MLTRGGEGTPFYDAQKAAKPAQALKLAIFNTSVNETSESEAPEHSLVAWTFDFLD